MKLLQMTQVHEGSYLHSYELTYENNSGMKKTFEMVSRRPLVSPKDLGSRPSGVTIAAWQKDRLLLLREFRMSVNRPLYNLCAGMLEEEESVEECAARELLEETGLRLARIHAILPPSFSAAGFSDTSTHLVFAEVAGRLGGHPSANEEIQAGFFTREQLASMLKTESFSALAQMAAWFFVSR